MKLGLRFQTRDARLLEALAAQVRNGEMGVQTANVFHQAALSARTGEPLVLHCTDPIEAVQMAVAYTLHGVTRPVIEELSGQ